MSIGIELVGTAKLQKKLEKVIHLEKSSLEEFTKDIIEELTLLHKIIFQADRDIRAGNNLIHLITKVTKIARVFDDLRKASEKTMRIVQKNTNIYKMAEDTKKYSAMLTDELKRLADALRITSGQRPISPLYTNEVRNAYDALKTLETALRRAQSVISADAQRALIFTNYTLKKKVMK